MHYTRAPTNNVLHYGRKLSPGTQPTVEVTAVQQKKTAYSNSLASLRATEDGRDLARCIAGLHAAADVVFTAGRA